jgi:hypothetical protein
MQGVHDIVALGGGHVFRQAAGERSEFISKASTK